MNRKTIFLVSMLLVLVLLISACSQQTQQNVETGEFTSGTYKAQADGLGGAVHVEVGFSADSIDSIVVTEHNETPGIGDTAIEKLPEQIINAQSLNIDVITGATITSNAIFDAVADCIQQAGGNVQKWRDKEPLTANAKPSEDEEITTDVVVVGAGIAGLSAALEALNNGADVIILEKMPAIGGSTVMSAGKVLAADSYVQRELGIEDSPEQFAEYLMNISKGQADPEFVNLVANLSSDTIDWMVENGVQFKNEVETPVPDMQPKRGLMTHDDTGAGLTQPLMQKIEEKGGVVLLETPGKELLTDENGDVVGILAERADGSKLTVHAKAVILATGGFSYNPELLEKYAPSYNVGRAFSGPGNTGDGLLMAEKIGAEIIAGDCLIAQLFDLGPTQRNDASGLYVDESGNRFMNENLPRPRKAKASISAIGQSDVYFIHDASEYTDNIPSGIESGLTFEADSIEELATLTGMDVDTLVNTVERYNELCKKGIDEDFGKDAESMKPIVEPKFYAIKLGINCVGTTGGPRINLDAQVMHKDGHPINGLYAAGEVASGSLFAYEYPGSGTAIQSYATFGRIAGSNSAKYALSK